MTSLPSETGGLLRVAIKLMMACSTTNIDVYVVSKRLGDAIYSSS